MKVTEIPKIVHVESSEGERSSTILQVSNRNFLMPALNLTELLSEENVTEQQWEWQLGSFGTVIAANGTCAYSHESYILPQEFHKNLGLNFVVNMDRGGIGTREKCHFGCILDGISGGGVVSAFVAQAGADFLLNLLNDKPLNFCEELDINKKIAKEIVFDLAIFIRDKLERFDSGGSTVLFADCSPIDGDSEHYFLNAVSLGDCAVFHICAETGKAQQLNKITRKLDDTGNEVMSSTGGNIARNGIIEGLDNLSIVHETISKNDFVVLVTDGYLDNIRNGEENKMTSWAIRSTFFDLPFKEQLSILKEVQAKELPTLPSLLELKACAEDCSIDNDLTAEKITKRLAAYVRLVTAETVQLEEDVERAKLEHKHKIESRAPEKEQLMAKKKLEKLESQLIKALDIKRNHVPKPDDDLIIVFTAAVP